MWERVIVLIGTLQLTLEMKQDFFPRQFFEYEARYKTVSSNYNVARLRLMTMMRTTYEDAWKRIIELNDMRFVVEETYEYEMGYVMHELYDRYKKLVEQYNKGANDIYNVHPAVTKYKDITFDPDKPYERFVFGYDKYERTELTQKLYFEIHHIANMIHEIPVKWQQADGSGAPTNEHFYINQEEKARMAAEREAYLKKLAKERLEKIKKLAASKNKGYKPGQDDGDWSKTDDFIRERMESQGWQAWLKKRQENRSSYMPPGWLYEYGWDVPILPEQQWKSLQ